MTGIFYVYEHWRPDTNQCFYVGKGKNRRAWSLKSRNILHVKATEELRAAGLGPDVRIIGNGMSEQAAFALEIERINHWRTLGVDLANRVNGGQGWSGWQHSPEHKAHIANKSRGRKHTPEARALLSAAANNRPPGYWDNISQKLSGRPLPAEHRAKLKEAHKNRPPISEETRAKMQAAQQARGTRSEETKARASASLKAWHAEMAAQGIRKTGVVRHSAETKAQMSVSAKAWRAERRSKTQPLAAESSAPQV